MFITLCILYHSGQFFPRASPLPWQISEARMWGAHTTFLTLLCQDAGAESLHPAFVTVSRTCNPECSRGGCCDSSGSAELLPCRTAPPGQWRLAKRVGCGAQEYLPSSPLPNCPWNTNFGNLDLQTPPRSTRYHSLVISTQRWHQKPSGGLGTSEKSGDRKSVV